jgi:geranylgeranyl diphosphate synthase, type II
MQHKPESLLSLLEQHMGNQPITGYPSELYEPIDYILTLGGKRLRPLLVLMAYNLYRDDVHHILTPALAVEVFHNFTLMHDDIMDEAPLRRSKATVHEKWGRNTAILSGDVMMVQAYEMLMKADDEYLREVLKRFNRTAAEVCEGQMLDMNFETLPSVDEVEYIDMIRLKTAVLLGFSLELGARLAGAPVNSCEKLYEFGVNIGIAFQLKDDLLDVYADQADFGKQVGGDIIANKKTFLMIMAQRLARGEQAKALKGWLSQKDFVKEEKVQGVTAIYNALGIRSLTEEKINSFFQEGLLSLKAVDAPLQRKTQLRKFAEALMLRIK